MSLLSNFLAEAFLEQTTDKVVVLMPGGFKPPHGGHLDLAKRYASHPQVQEVRILIGPKERDGITREQSMAVWKLLLTGVSNVSVEAVQQDNPLLASYKYIETAPPGKYALAASNKGEDYDRVVKFTAGHAKGGKYAKPGLVVVNLPLDVKPLLYANRPDQLKGKPISASTVRADLAAGDFNKFVTSYPGTSPGVLKQVYNVLKPSKGRINEGGADSSVSCAMCGASMKQITPNHLKFKHNTSIEAYTLAYPDQPTHSTNLRTTLRENNPMHSSIHRESALKAKIKQYGSLAAAANKAKAAQTKLDRYGDPNYNNPRFGDANSSRRPEVRARISQRVKESYTPELRALRSKHFKKTRSSAQFKERMYELGLMYRPGERVDKVYYTQRVRELTQRNFSKYFHRIENAKLRGYDHHLDHKLSIWDGYRSGIAPEIIAHPANLQMLTKQLNEDKGKTSSLSLTELIREINQFNQDSRSLLVCGGAAGHLVHPYEDLDLTFQDVETMITLVLSGEIKSVQEKLDGQNLMVSYKGGRVVAARNKGQLKNFGENSLSVKQVEDMFAGRGPIQAAFSEAMRDLETAIGKLTVSQRSMFFQNGKRFLNLEVLYPATANVVPYGTTQLRLHNIRTYDQEGNVIDEDQQAAKQLDGALRQVQADNQKTYQIKVTNPLSITKSADYDKQKEELLAMVNSIREQSKLQKNDKVKMYYVKWWTNFVSDQAKKQGYKIPTAVRNQLVGRWGFDSKQVNIRDIRNQVDNEAFRSWIDQFDKTGVQATRKEAAKPLEHLFLKLGVYALRNIQGLVALNPNQSVSDMGTSLKNAIAQIKTSQGADAPEALSFLKRELSRLNDIGGFSAILPTEGLVFKYNDKLFKLTGAFAPMNKIIGYLKFQ